MSKLLAWALAISCTVPAAAQTKTLIEKSHVPTTATFEGYRNFQYPIACDDKGRMYVKLIPPGTEWTGPLLRVSKDGVLEAQFDTSHLLKNTNVFAVRPKGGVAMVEHGSQSRAPLVVRNFGNDGKPESNVTLDSAPLHFFPQQIAVFSSGEMLLAGPTVAPRGRGDLPTVAIFGTAGNLIKKVELDGDADLVKAMEAGGYFGQDPISESQAITGDDGFVYLMRKTSPARIYVISSAGEVVRKIAVQAPMDLGFPSQVRVARNRLAISWSVCRTDSGCTGWGDYLVVNAANGQELAEYHAEREARGMLGCYAPDPDRFYLLQTSMDLHRLEIIEAQAK